MTRYGAIYKEVLLAEERKMIRDLIERGVEEPDTIAAIMEFTDRLLVEEETVVEY